MTSIEEGIAAVKAAFPDAEVVEVRKIGIPWCKAFDNELRKVRRQGRRVLLFQELMWAAWNDGRKIGWASWFYKELYGEWPPWSWRELPPIETREATRRMIARRIGRSRKAWKEQKDAERAERERQADLLAAAEAEDREEAEVYADRDAGEDGGMEGELGASLGDGDVPDGERLT